jgi:hypothetical protein
VRVDGHIEARARQLDGDGAPYAGGGARDQGAGADDGFGHGALHAVGRIASGARALDDRRGQR